MTVCDRLAAMMMLAGLVASGVVFSRPVLGTDELEGGMARPAGEDAAVEEEDGVDEDAVEDGAAAEGELVGLRRRVEVLEQRIGILERRLEHMEELMRDRPGVPPERPMPPLLPMPGPRLPQREAVPEGWIPFEHDGLRYYLVPLASDGEE